MSRFASSSSNYSSGAQGAPAGWVPEGREKGRCQGWAASMERQCKRSHDGQGPWYCAQHRDQAPPVLFSDRTHPNVIKPEAILPARRDESVTCFGVNKDGKTRCGRKTRSLSGYCHQHESQAPDEMVLRSSSDGSGAARGSPASISATPTLSQPARQLGLSMKASPDRTKRWDWSAAEYKARTAQNGHDYTSEAPGYVYVISLVNPRTDVLAVKIGRTKRSAQTRFREIQSGSSHPLCLVYVAETQFHVLLERTVHELLKPLRRTIEAFGRDGRTELFEMTCEEAQEAIKSAGHLIAEARDMEYDSVVFSIQDVYRDGEGGVQSAPASASSYAYKRAVPANFTPRAAQPGDVYRTPTGKKYHTSSCQYYNPSYPLSVAEANAQRLGPCSKCHPPTLDTDSGPRVATVPSPLRTAYTSPAASSSSVGAPTRPTVTVYCTPTGKKYHTNTCRHYNPSYPLTLAQADARGLDPCKVCRAPASDMYSAPPAATVAPTVVPVLPAATKSPSSSYEPGYARIGATRNQATPSMTRRPYQTAPDELSSESDSSCEFDDLDDYLVPNISVPRYTGISRAPVQTPHETVQDDIEEYESVSEYDTESEYDDQLVPSEGSRAVHEEEDLEYGPECSESDSDDDYPSVVEEAAVSSRVPGETLPSSSGCAAHTQRPDEEETPSGATSKPGSTPAPAVYVNPLGLKFHTDACRHFDSRRSVPVSAEDAKKKQLEPCLLCKPLLPETPALPTPPATPASSPRSLSRAPSSSTPNPSPLRGGDGQSVAVATVFTTANGTKYHISGCKFADARYPISVAKAVLDPNLSPCGVCKPPVSAQGCSELTPLATPPKTVYRTPNGTKFHAGSCRHLMGKTEVCETLVISEAREQGLEACGMCAKDIFDNSLEVPAVTPLRPSTESGSSGAGRVIAGPSVRSRRALFESL